MSKGQPTIEEIKLYQCLVRSSLSATLQNEVGQWVSETVSKAGSQFSKNIFLPRTQESAPRTFTATHTGKLYLYYSNKIKEKIKSSWCRTFCIIDAVSSL